MVPATSVCYQRVPGIAFRWVRGEVFIARRGHRNQRLGGAAAVVWMVLDRPGKAEDMLERIGESYSDAAQANLPLIIDAIEALVTGALIHDVRPVGSDDDVLKD